MPAVSFYISLSASTALICVLHLKFANLPAQLTYCQECELARMMDGRQLSMQFLQYLLNHISEGTSFWNRYSALMFDMHQALGVVPSSPTGWSKPFGLLSSLMVRSYRISFDKFKLGYAVRSHVALLSKPRCGSGMKKFRK